jgi:hypothetical protein
MKANKHGLIPQRITSCGSLLTVVTRAILEVARLRRRKLRQKGCCVSPGYSPRLRQARTAGVLVDRANSRLPSKGNSHERV